MKLLVCTDIHSSRKALKKLAELAKRHNPDAIVCCGDVSMFEIHFKATMRSLASLKRPTILVHGNHEDAAMMKKYCKPYKHFHFIHGNHFIMGDCLFLGYGGDGFSVVDPLFMLYARQFEKVVKQNKDKKLILVTHAPPQRTKLDKIVGGHCGNKSIRQFIEKYQPAYAFSGHIHENFGKKDFIRETIVMNPGPFGKIVEV
jgi:Icc-related predicted phosphoesterase